MIATLTGIFGARHLDLAEEVVQEALLEALRRWPIGGVPEQPAAWLVRVARNRALDRLRRRSTFDRKKGTVVSLMEARLQRLPSATFEGEIDDDQLRLIFTCCHPGLPGDARIALTLKTVCGFSVKEIAGAFLTRETTVAQRLVRAKRLIAEQRIPYSVPGPRELPQRLHSVLHVLYLMFNEGYSPTEAETVVRADICRDAVRLAEIVAAHAVAGLPESQALAALLLLQGARLETRQDAAGDILLLEEQDRDRWNQEWLQRGFRNLRSAMRAGELTPYHLEAGIAACHAAAKTWEETDWRAILRHYDRLLEIAPSPIRGLNRTVALAMVEGAASALLAIKCLDDEPELRSYYLLPAVRGELNRRVGRALQAREEFARALEFARGAPVRRFLRRRLASVG